MSTSQVTSVNPILPSITERTSLVLNRREELTKQNLLISKDILGVIFSFGNRTSLKNASYVCRQWKQIMSMVWKDGLALQLRKVDFYRAQDILITYRRFDREERIALGESEGVIPTEVLNLAFETGYLLEKDYLFLRDPIKLTDEILDQGLENLVDRVSGKPWKDRGFPLNTKPTLSDVFSNIPGNPYENDIGYAALHLIQRDFIQIGIEKLKKLHRRSVFLPSHCEDICKELIKKGEYLKALEVANLLPMGDHIEDATRNRIKESLILNLFSSENFDEVEAILKKDGCLDPARKYIVKSKMTDEYIEGMIRFSLKKSNLVEFLSKITSTPLKHALFPEIAKSISKQGLELEAEKIVDMIEDVREKKKCFSLLLDYWNVDKIATKNDIIEFSKQIKSSFFKNKLLPELVTILCRQNRQLEATQIAKIIEDPEEKKGALSSIYLSSLSNRANIKSTKQIFNPTIQPENAPTTEPETNKDSFDLPSPVNLDKINPKKHLIHPSSKPENTPVSIPRSNQDNLQPNSPLNPNTVNLEEQSVKAINQTENVPIIDPRPNSVTIPVTIDARRLEPSRQSIPSVTVSRMDYAKTSLTHLWHRSFVFRILSVASFGLIPLITFLFKLVFSKHRVTASNQILE